VRRVCDGHSARALTFPQSLRQPISDSLVPKPLVNNANAMPSIPVDILLLILDHVDKADLLTICLLNKICCSCSQDVLYRNIRIDGDGYDSKFERI
jgi:hypothetical protein